MNRLGITLLASALVLPVVFGCGSDQRATYPVSGKVVFEDGKPMTGGTVEFASEEALKTQLSASAGIQSDGTFRLSTFAENDGAVEGKHKAIVVPPISMSAERVQGVIHPRFMDYKTSGLEFTVKPEDNHFTITVARP